MPSMIRRRAGSKRLLLYCAALCVLYSICAHAAGLLWAQKATEDRSSIAVGEQDAARRPGMITLAQRSVPDVITDPLLAWDGVLCM
jgi:hypothetical protein